MASAWTGWASTTSAANGMGASPMGTASAIGTSPTAWIGSTEAIGMASSTNAAIGIASACTGAATGAAAGGGGGALAGSTLLKSDLHCSQNRAPSSLAN